MDSEEKIDKIYDIVLEMSPLVKAHNNTLYGNGRKGLEKEVLLMKRTQDDCPARIAATSEGKKLTISQIMMVIAIIGLFVSTVLGALNFFKGQ